MKNLDSILSSYNVSKWGIVSSSVPITLNHFKKWVEHKQHEPLGYLADERAIKREDIKNYFPEFKSALVMAFDYSRIAKVSKEFYQSKDSNGLKIANYVLGFEGVDYHYYLRDKLDAISLELKKYYPEIEIKLSLDTQPVLERDLAMQAGLGWFGKNSMLINRDIGSYFIIGSLLLSEDLSQLNTEKIVHEVDHCGQCTRCIEACPTNAIDVNSRTIVANKCISTFTIELFKEAPAPEGMSRSSGEIYGCDICQDVCPWNSRVERQSSPVIGEELSRFKALEVVQEFLMKPLESIIEKLEGLSNREYRKRLQKSPVARTGRIGMLKNLKLY